MSRRWKNKKLDQLEKVGKIRRRRSSSAPVDLKEEFELDDDHWRLGGDEGAFVARVVEVHKRYAFVSVESEAGRIDTSDVWLATVARRFLQAKRDERNFVAVGDRVLCVPSDEPGGDATNLKSVDLPSCVIQNLAPRKSRLARLDPHTSDRLHVLASNMDQVMIVASFLKPKVKWGLIDRYLVMAESEDMGALIVLNKRDLLDSEARSEFKQDALDKIELYRQLGYPVFLTQANDAGARSDPEIDRLGAALRGNITLLSGHSGVGKSSIVNLFDPEIIQEIEPDEDIFYKGRHTTTYASFINLRAPGGYAIDTPGIRSFTFGEKNAIELSHCFVEMRPFVGQCKYRECRHIDEPDCVIKEAVQAGKISGWRYRSYLAILLGASGREGRLRDVPEISED